MQIRAAVEERGKGVPRETAPMTFLRALLDRAATWRACRQELVRVLSELQRLRRSELDSRSPLIIERLESAKPCLLTAGRSTH